ncbi:MAG: hypothetical protein U1F10_08740 [Burkholderiales bacterium]
MNASPTERIFTVSARPDGSGCARWIAVVEEIVLEARMHREELTVLDDAFPNSCTALDAAEDFVTQRVRRCGSPPFTLRRLADGGAGP